MNDDERVRFLAESGELTTRYAEAIADHIGRMASINVDLRQENDRLRRTILGIGASIRYAADVACEELGRGCRTNLTLEDIGERANDALAREDRLRAAREEARNGQ